MALLREYELADKADLLKAEGVASSRDVLDMSESDAKEVRQHLKLRFRFIGLWKDIQAREQAEEGAAAFERTIDDLKQRADVAALVQGMRSMPHILVSRRKDVWRCPT